MKWTRDDIIAVIAALTLAIALPIAGAAAALLLFPVKHAGAHEWYDAACCSDEDCHVIDWSELQRVDDKWIWTSAKSGAVHIINVNSVSPVDKQPRIRVSKDGKLHGCERNTADKPGEPDRWVAYCLYFPALF